MVWYGMLLARRHLWESTRHCPLLLEVIGVRLVRRGLKLTLHLHVRLEALVRALVRHHRWAWTVVKVLATVLLHMRHVRLCMRWHWREPLLGHWAVSIASRVLLHHHVTPHEWSIELRTWTISTGTHLAHLSLRLSWHHHHRAALHVRLAIGH